MNKQFRMLRERTADEVNAKQWVEQYVAYLMRLRAQPKGEPSAQIHSIAWQGVSTEPRNTMPEKGIEPL